MRYSSAQKGVAIVLGRHSIVVIRQTFSGFKPFAAINIQQAAMAGVPCSQESPTKGPEYPPGLHTVV